MDVTVVFIYKGIKLPCIGVKINSKTAKDRGAPNTPWLRLASWNLPDSQLSRESKIEPSVANTKYQAGAELCQAQFRLLPHSAPS